MANYTIQWMPDEDMDGQDFILCNKHQGSVILYMNKRVRSMSDEDNAAVWEDAWLAFRQLAQVGEIPSQRQRNADLAELLMAVVTL